MHVRRSALLCFLGSILTSTVGSGPVSGLLAAETDIIVATNGNDQWSGHLADPNAAGTDGPVATVVRAQQLVRELKASQPQRNTPIVVAIRGGLHVLAAPILIGVEELGK